jgi:hypothetical protein
MNKGILLAISDIVEVLNFEDFYISNDIIAKIVTEFFNMSIDSIFADIHYVKNYNLLNSFRSYSG